MMRSQIPKFRLPDTVIDEETDYILNLGVEFKGGHRIDSLKKLLNEITTRSFIGSGAPRGRELDIPGRKEAAANLHTASNGWASVSFGHVEKIGRRVIVLGGGNTAMDCCRTARRLGGADVKVIVRSGFEEMKASPWEKEDALHEDIPILNFMVPVAFKHVSGKLIGVTFQKVKGRIRRQGPPQPGALGRTGPDHPWRRRAGRGRDRRTRSPGSSATAASSSTSGTCRRVDAKTFVSTNPKCSRRRRRVRPEEHHLGGRARP